MVTTRNTKADVVAAAGRMFAEKGYHGTSMRELGKEIGLLGSSLYSHIDSKEDLLVEVVDEGARLFLNSADAATSGERVATAKLRALISGHIDVVLDNLDVVRTYLNEARMLEDEHRSRVVASRDKYEAVFRSVIEEGQLRGEFGSDIDPKLGAIFILSILNAIERWYRPSGALDRDALTDQLVEFLASGLA